MFAVCVQIIIYVPSFNFALRSLSLDLFLLFLLHAFVALFTHAIDFVFAFHSYLCDILLPSMQATKDFSLLFLCVIYIISL